MIILWNCYSIIIVFVNFAEKTYWKKNLYFLELKFWSVFVGIYPCLIQLKTMVKFLEQSNQLEL